MHFGTTRRWFTLAAAALAVFAASPASAVDWPTRTVTVVVPFPAGSTPDTAARVVSERLQAKLGQPFVIENKSGASGNLGTNAVAKAAPDGYTIGVSIVGPLALNTLLFPSMPYNPKTDLAFVSVIVSQPSILVLNKDLGVTTTEQLIARLKDDPSKFNFGSIGNGSLSHLAMEAIAMRSGTRPKHVPYPGSPAVMNDLMRGDVQMAVMPAGSVVPLARDGRVTMLAVTSAKRSKLLPDLPTLAEAGVTDVEADAWIGLIAPAKTPLEILTKLETNVREILAEPDVQKVLAVQYMEAIASTPAEFRARVDAELERWGPVIKANDIKLGQ